MEDGKCHADRDGLVLEIRPSGKKVFIFRFQWEKKPQTMTLSKGIDPRKKDAPELPKRIFKEVVEQWHSKNSHLFK